MEDVTRRQVWSWDGNLYTPSMVDYQPAPEYRFEAVLHGDLANKYRGDYSQALGFFQQAIFDESLLGWSQGYDPTSSTPLTPDPLERPRLEAYSRYRIMVLHAQQGDVASAKTVLQSLQAKFSPDTPYVQLAEIFWESYEHDGRYHLACEAASEIAMQRAEEILVPLGTAFYGPFGRDYEPEDICPVGFYP
jgi:hypothetical protein